jgi:hypothetical protein
MARSTAYIPNAYPWVNGMSLFNPGNNIPRANTESNANVVRIWPTTYRIPAYGLSAQLSFVRGPSTPVQNNRYAPMNTGFNVMMPGLNKTPFG